jgi:hypothetical protein
LESLVIHTSVQAGGTLAPDGVERLTPAAATSFLGWLLGLEEASSKKLPASFARERLAGSVLFFTDKLRK